MESSIRSAIGRVALSACLVGALARPVAAQQRAPAPRPAANASVAGRVETPGAKEQLPVPGVMVTVHRVGADSSGPLDSVRTDALGRYAIQYTKSGADNAVYFAAAVYRGIAYFTAPLQSARAVGEEAEITVFDTTSKIVKLHVQGHHFVVSSPSPNGTRNIVEVWELSNDTTVTLVGRDTLTAVWGTRAPAGATGFAGGPGDVTPASLVLRGDSVALLATFGPGVKQISYTYALPASSFPLSVPVTQETGVLEVLVEEAQGQVTGAGLHAMDAANSQGRTFKRWLGQDVHAGETFRVTVPTTSAAVRTRLLLGVGAVFIAVMALALVLAFRARTPKQPTVADAEPTREMLVAAIATLDARKQRGDATLSDAEYAEQRAALKARLASQLAAETPPA